MSGDINIYYCVGCGIVHPKGNFYVSYSDVHANGRLFYCKKIIRERSYIDGDQTVELEGFKRVLRELNVPFLNDVFESALSSGSDIVGAYFRMFNSLLQYRGLTWDDSVFKSEEEDEDSTIAEDVLGVGDIDLAQEAIDRWGGEYNPEQIAQLERFYHTIKDSNNVSPQDLFYLEKLSVISLKMNEELENGNYAQSKQLGDLFSKYMADSNFRAADNKDGEKNRGMRTFSAIYSEVEKDGHIPPWEHYRKMKGLTQDVLDKTIMHIENFTLRFNKAETMTEPPCDTPRVAKDEVDPSAKPLELPRVGEVL